MHANELRCFETAIEDRLTAAEDLAAAGEYTTALYKTISAVQEVTRLVNALAREKTHA